MIEWNQTLAANNAPTYDHPSSIICACSVCLFAQKNKNNDFGLVLLFLYCLRLSYKCVRMYQLTSTKRYSYEIWSIMRKWNQSNVLIEQQITIQLNINRLFLSQSVTPSKPRLKEDFWNNFTNQNHQGFLLIVAVNRSPPLDYMSVSHSLYVLVPLPPIDLHTTTQLPLRPKTKYKHLQIQWPHPAAPNSHRRQSPCHSSIFDNFVYF